MTIEKAAALEEAAAARVVRELRAEINDPTIGRCRACGARTAPWASLCDRCFMARGYKAGRREGKPAAGLGARADAARGAARQSSPMAQADDFTGKHDEFRAWTDQLRAAARLLPSLDNASRFAVVADLVAFLQERVEPHTHVDEQVLYPRRPRRGGSPLAAAAMAYAPRHPLWIAKLAEADEEDVSTLQELLYGLDALIRVHLWKEDELFVKPLSPPAGRRRAPSRAMSVRHPPMAGTALPHPAGLSAVNPRWGIRTGANTMRPCRSIPWIACWTGARSCSASPRG